jgi:Fe-S cluster assembly ATPase SufC
VIAGTEGVVGLEVPQQRAEERAAMGILLVLQAPLENSLERMWAGNFHISANQTT